MLYLKFDVCEALTAAGYGPARCQSEGIVGNLTWYRMKRGKVPGPKVLDTICSILELQPGAIVGWKLDQQEDGDDLEALPEA